MKRLLALFLLLPALAFAHVNSPDVYVQTTAGPYPLSVVVIPPDAIPGTAQVQVRGIGIASLSVSPFPMSGEAAKHPPKPEALTRSKADPNLYTASVWIMSEGAWQIKLFATGDKGPADTSIPLPSAATKIKPMSIGMTLGLASFGLLLVVGAVAIIGASVRDAKLAPTTEPSSEFIMRGRIAMAVASLSLVVVLLGGARWWNSEASNYSAQLYKPLQMSALANGGRLTLDISDPGWTKARRLDDLIPDHGHLMHLYALRLPEMDHVYHLHPDQLEAGEFALTLPTMPAGMYQLFADIVHADGFSETITTQAELPTVIHRRLTGDDAGGEVTPLSHASDAPEYILPDGYRVRWSRPTYLRAKQPMQLRFQLLDADGKPASDAAPYMGMAAHAAVVKDDGTVFAHIHPLGTVSMAATALLQPENIHQHSEKIPPEVTIPYGFPQSGAYRIIVQMRRANTTETAAFDTLVTQ